MTGEPEPRRNGRLVLARRAGEAIQLGDDITIVVHEFPRLGEVRLAIQAPPHVRIMRTELLGAEERPGSAGQGGC